MGAGQAHHRLVFVATFHSFHRDTTYLAGSHDQFSGGGLDSSPGTRSSEVYQRQKFDGQIKKWLTNTVMLLLVLVAVYFTNRDVLDLWTQLAGIF